MTDDCTDTRTRLRRRPERAVADRSALDEVLDQALICHVGFVHDGYPVVIPTIHARQGDVLLVHGSPASRMLRDLAGGIDVCVTVTIVDALVLSKSWFHHSLNYRSAVIFGRAVALDDDAAKLEALRCVVEHVQAGRTGASRPPTVQELRQTLVLSVPLTEWSVKSRTGPPVEDPADVELDFQNGVVPLAAAGFDAGGGRRASGSP
jgi:nitroimidazol reductase NimA-like FMN-containing flavoprotein (pyridoxamine 5'-phosphate oxidase superfamily)